MIEYPTEIYVECDECGDGDNLATEVYTGDPESVGIPRENFEEAGWYSDSGTQLCPKCRGDD